MYLLGWIRESMFNHTLIKWDCPTKCVNKNTEFSYVPYNWTLFSNKVKN
ncbi:hypothetical protein QE382_003836 [Sphingobacterium zeae]|uniref:Uncharacterized protein n=1 Tax=Sphingobacterium zeae TaxID=1776859 RepID=A0ABU0UAE8_9SPHI|nr:hypothetical protein [Sphingobacterium zeae]